MPLLPVAWHRLHAGETLHHEGAVADAIHFVRAGAFKIFRTAEDGYEQVLGFAVRGEVLGFEALANGTHPSARDGAGGVERLQPAAGRIPVAGPAPAANWTCWCIAR